MNRAATALTLLALASGLAACGDDEDTTATTSATTTEEARGYGSDEPFAVEATLEAIEDVDGTTVLTAKATDGKTYEVVVPPDVTLDDTTQQVFAKPDCAGKVLANLELVDAPDHEELGDSVLVTASIDTESCL